MTRLRLLAVVLLLLGAVPPPKASAPAEPSAVDQAKAFLPVSCAAAKESCAETTKLLGGYLALLDEALTCIGAKCPVEKVNDVFEKDRKLDEREHLLPPRARSADSKRPLLRLSLFVTTAAGLALEAADPKAKPPAAANAEVEAGKVLEQICGLGVGGACGEARGLLRRLEDLASGASACEAQPCAFAEQERLGVSAEAALGGYFRVDAMTGYDTLPFFSMLRASRVRIARMLGRASAAKLAELEAGEKALTAGVERLEKDRGGGNLDGRIAALRKREDAVLKSYQDASITHDRTNSLLMGDPDNFASRSRINASAAKLASARGRLMALKAAQGLGGGRDAGSIVQTVLLEAGKASLGIATLGGPRPAAAPRTVPIDRRAVPLAPPANPSAPPILKTSSGLLDLIRNRSSSDPLVAADAQRRLGLTRTLGDPAGRAPLLHPQEGSDTCAIVAQQQILAAHGLVPKADPVKTEKLLAKEAKDRGFYVESAGTPRAYQADLLIDRGLIVTKQTAAPLATLDAAVRRGGMIIASVDARHLWNQKGPKALGHAILITGAEIGRFNGETLGYYINDSGVPRNGAGRFVPIAQFTKAWNSYTKSFSEVR